MRPYLLIGLMLLVFCANLSANNEDARWQEHCFAVQRKLQKAFDDMNREQNYSVKTLDPAWWDEAIRRKYIRKRYHDPGQGLLSTKNFLCDHSEQVLCRVHGQHPEGRTKNLCFDIQWRLNYEVSKLEKEGQRVDVLSGRDIMKFKNKKLHELIKQSGGLSKHDFQIDEFGGVYCAKHGRLASREREYRCFKQQKRIKQALRKFWHDNPNERRELNGYVFRALWRGGYLDSDTERMDCPGKGEGTHHHYGMTDTGKVTCRNHRHPRERPRARALHKGWLLNWKKSNQ